MKTQEYVINGKRFLVEILASDGRNAEVKVNGVSYQVEIPASGPPSQVSPPPLTARVSPPPAAVQPAQVQPPPPPRQPPAAQPPSSARSMPSHPSENQVVSPMPGTILNVLVEPGQSVRAGEALLILEAMKMENEIHAPRDGVVRKLHVSKGVEVQAGSLLLDIE
jgi:biotin carboxyl carrier protein